MGETQSALRFNRSLWLLCRNRWGQGEEQEGLRGDGEIIQVGRDRGLAGAGAAKAVRSSCKENKSCSDLNSFLTEEGSGEFI